MHPHIYITADQIEGLRSVENVRQGIRDGHLEVLWNQLRALADADVARKPFIPSSVIPGRPQLDIEHENRDWILINAVAQRIQRAALAYLLSERPEYRNDALRQMEAVFDTNTYPDWRDKAHPRTRVDLRAGQLSQAIALAYDWMHPLLSSEERSSILEGLDKRAIQLYLQDVDDNAYWLDVRTNWLTTVVGGHGIAGMALGLDHLLAQDLIDIALPRMVDYLSRFGPEGEFSESVGYASSTAQPVAFFNALRYASGGGVNRLAEHPFPQTCHWILYFTLPPGRYAAFGDGHIDAPPALSYIPAVADATRDPYLQRFYLDYAHIAESRRSLTQEILCYDPTLEPASLDGHIPTGRAFTKHDAGFSSRDSWDPVAASSVVYGKAGSGAIVHGHHDVGQVCIDGYGERLIVDLGSPPGYPGDYGSHKYEYYNAAAHGHNILLFGGREMKHDATVEARILNASFKDGESGLWRVDLTDKYDGARSVRRTVVHLHPATIAVLDEADLEIEESISLRWHTASLPKQDGSGRFTVTGAEASLAARMLSLDTIGLTFDIHRHEYNDPYNRHRLGDRFDQCHEPYVEAVMNANRCRILTLFTILPTQVPASWLDAESGWTTETTEGRVTATLDRSTLTFHTPRCNLQFDLMECSCPDTH